MLQSSYVFSDVLNFWRNKEALQCNKTNLIIDNYSDDVRASSDDKIVDLPTEKIVFSHSSVDVGASTEEESVEEDQEDLVENVDMENEEAKENRESTEDLAEEGHIEEGEMGEDPISLGEGLEEFEGSDGIFMPKIFFKERDVEGNEKIIKSEELTEEDLKRIGDQISDLYSLHLLEVGFKRMREAEENYNKSWRGRIYNAIGRHFCCFVENDEDSEDMEDEFD